MKTGNRHESIGNNKRAKVLGFALSVMLSTLCHSVNAQQPAKIPRIGYVSGSGDVNNPGPPVKAFRQGLRDLGYIEGKNILVEYRYAEGMRDRISGLVVELVGLKLDVLVLHDTSAIHAAKQATQTTPIVMVATQDPVATGIVDSLARPGEILQGSPGLPEN